MTAKKRGQSRDHLESSSNADTRSVPKSHSVGFTGFKVVLFDGNLQLFADSVTNVTAYSGAERTAPLYGVTLVTKTYISLHKHIKYSTFFHEETLNLFFKDLWLRYTF